MHVLQFHKNAEERTQVGVVLNVEIADNGRTEDVCSSIFRQNCHYNTDVDIDMMYIEWTASSLKLGL